MQQAKKQKQLSDKKVTTYLNMAFCISRLSKDKDTKVGAVIVSPCLTKFSVGYNGPPRGIEDTEERLTRPMKYEYMIHAEENAIINAGRDLRYNHLFITLSPCPKCALKIINVGIKDVYFPPPKTDSHKEHTEKSLELFKEAGVNVHMKDYPIAFENFYKMGFNDGAESAAADILNSI